MITVDGLRKVYGDFVAVHGSTFDVEPGEIFGVVGPNGAGKTTTLKTLAGLIEPTAGTVEVAGAPAGDPETRTALGFLPEESPLYEDMTARSYLRFFADLYEVPRETANRRIETALDDLELEHRDRRLGDVSKGMKRKVAIARSLVNDPDVLIYDEPASGLDPLTTNYVLEYVRALADAGKTVLFSAHNLYHVESVCDRVVIMNEGRIVARGTVEEIRAEHGETSYRVFTTVPVEGSEPDGDRHRAVVGSMDAVEDLRAQATDAGGEVVDIRTRESTLEEIFLDVAGRPMAGSRRIDAAADGAPGATDAADGEGGDSAESPPEATADGGGREP
ncbi:ABC transporter ATP-binding protein [Halobaculum lipolyticum]|uniref:ATP-binding cassette domain-containing protein n=1 Tax=Halobaculum lipolyticum TaxID=3032001 RepID=A0ABD5WHY4_9EURY|nr:ABC transporter ATP-binding protein [Halobaculum sp. DT31]